MFAAVVAGSVPIIAQLTSAMPKLAPKQKKGPTLAQAKEINAFLASVERRAFKHAAYAVRDDEAALDIVRDTMIRLAERYADRPTAKPLPGWAELPLTIGVVQPSFAPPPAPLPMMIAS